MNYQTYDAAARAEHSSKRYADQVMIKHLRYEHEWSLAKLMKKFRVTRTDLKYILGEE